MQRHKYPKHFCSTCGMSMNSTCRAPVDTTADEFLHRRHVRQIERDNFRKNRRVRYQRRDVVAQVAPESRKKKRETKESRKPRWNPRMHVKIGDAYFFYVENERTPARTRNYRTEVRSFAFNIGMHRSALCFFHYLFILPSRETDPVSIYVNAHNTENRKRWT